MNSIKRIAVIALLGIGAYVAFNSIDLGIFDVSDPYAITRMLLHAGCAAKQATCR